ncbi:MAG: hypothetical protein DI629_07710 [Mesorhizobium amorphae]|nr:MAG: hypothetical protein DI629_07710 [Mesorhizobium amorphae]
MFGRILRKSSGPTPPGLQSYLSDLFLDGPTADPDLPSLVHVREDGSVSGFIGVLPMALEHEGAPVRGALCCSMMVDRPEEDPFAGARLLRGFMAGPQDISLTETANDISTTMWRKMRGLVLNDYSLEWLRVIRPAGFAAALAATRFGPARLLAPLARPFDRFLGGRRGADPRWTHPDAGAKGRVLKVEDASESTVAELLPRLTAHYPMRPRWDGDTLSRMLVHARVKRRYGGLAQQVVSSPGGQPLGLFVYYGDPGGIGRAVQVVAVPGQEGAVIDAMVNHAAERGLVAIRGRSQPNLLNVMLGRRFIFVHASSSIATARDPRLLEPFTAGKAFFNGFAGESWTRLMGDEFD